MKKLACLVVALGTLALVSIPTLILVNQSAYFLIVGVAVFLGVLSSYRLKCEAVNLIAMVALIFYRPVDPIIGLYVAGIVFAFYHVCIYLEALFSKIELSVTKSVLFFLSTVYAFFLVCYWQVVTIAGDSFIIKNFFVAQVWHGVVQYFAPIFCYVLLGETLVLLLFSRKQNTVLNVLYTLLTLFFVGSVVMTFHAMARIWLLTFGGLALFAAGKAGKQQILQVLGVAVLGFTALLLLSNFVVLKVIRH